MYNYLPAGLHIESGYTDNKKLVKGLRNRRGSQNYVMTAHIESAGDMLELETIRKAVKIINMEAKRAEESSYRNPLNSRFPRYRVKCQGRGPRASVARAEGVHPRRYDRSLPLSKAERMDVYIYEQS
tara:strand:- start:157 stop:537 length:381 start_codon:yes stop_codon:yes gene_type:complete